MIVSFKFYVMNFVDFVLNFYSYITSHVSQVFTSFTHYTSYSLLNIVHVIVCVFGLTNQVWKYFEFFVQKQNWCLRICEEYLKILSLGKLGLKLVFLKIIASYTHAFLFINFNALRCFYNVSLFFSKTVFFSRKFCEPLSTSIDPICFLINQKCFKIFKEAFVCFDQSKLIFDQSKLVNQVFKNQSLTFQTYFSKRFSNFFSLSELDKASP